MAKSDPQKERADIAEIREMVRTKTGGAHFYAALLGMRSFETRSLLEKVELGFPFKTFERLRQNLGLQTIELADLVQIRERTLARRRESGRLTADESDRLVRVSRVYGKALALFDGDLKATSTWFSTPALALANRTPQEVSNSDLGAREVENLIGRLEHGVFS